MNIVLLHSHDTGRYLQPYGHAIPTLNLQRLAEQGILFRQAFCANPTCSPSRACLLTGQWAHCNGMLGLAHRGFRADDYSRFLTHTLKKAGYLTALAGVQHEARLPAADPQWLGYDLLLNHARDGGCDHATTLEVALRFLSKRQPPFFLSVGFAETHREFPEPGRDANPHYLLPPAPLPDTPETRQDMAGFIASARALDEKIGGILRALEANGLSEQTLVIYTTDHGIAFPGMKCNLTDHGIGVALILRGPAGLGGGRIADAMVTHLDLFPTLCEWLQIEAPAWLQGKSWLPMVRGEVPQLHQAIFAEVNYHAAYEPQRCVRTQRYKYIRRFDGRTAPVLPNCDDGLAKDVWLQAGWRERRRDSEELFDLVFDPQESDNLAGDQNHALVLEEMRRRLERWMRDTDDPLLLGHVPAPSGAVVNDPDGLSPGEPTRQPSLP